MIDQTALARMFGIEGKVAVITDSGALSSINVAPALARAGAKVVIADRDAAATESLADSIRAAGGEALAVPTNVEVEEEVVALFERVGRDLGSLDILVNCAGMIANQPFTEATLKQFDEIVSINLRSTFVCMREGVRAMIAGSKGGRIVNITTIGSLHPVLFGNQIYGSTRAAVTMLTRTTAMDYLPHGILANLVLPGAVHGKTSFHDSLKQSLAVGQPMHGPGTERTNPQGPLDPADIAAAVLYLVGPSGSYITGQAIVLDGGFLTM